MPELPEVETVVRDLRPLLAGRRVRAVRVGPHKLRRPWDAAWTGAVAGATVAGVRRRGKWILVDLDAGGVLVVHLGMTGQLTVVPAADPVQTHTHLVFELDAGTHELRFRDSRRFGSATLFASQLALDEFLADRLGPEPWDLTPEYFRAAVRKSNRPLKALLLDQAVVAGVGNIYADEALFHAKLPPTLRGTKATPEQVNRLRAAVTTVLEKAITGRGSTIRDYVGGAGLAGTYQNEFQAYGRTGDPCGRCGTAIACVRLAGRSTHYCPACQGPAAKTIRTPRSRAAPP